MDLGRFIYSLGHSLSQPLDHENTQLIDLAFSRDPRGGSHSIHMHIQVPRHSIFFLG